MIFRLYREGAEQLLRIPGPPAPPPGDDASARVFQASPRFYWYLLVTWLLRTVIAVIAIAPMSAVPIFGRFLRSVDDFSPNFIPGPPLFLLGLILLQRFWALALLRLDFEKRYYLATDRSLRVREGVTHVREMTITFANIQNISISQGPLQRLFRIADLQVDTAGGGAGKKSDDEKEGSHGVRFRGVDNAAQIRDLINERVRRLKDAGLGDVEERQRPRPTAPPAASAGLMAALREVREEARRLRETSAARPR